jgi:hypothetical protein
MVLLHVYIPVFFGLCFRFVTTTPILVFLILVGHVLFWLGRPLPTLLASLKDWCQEMKHVVKGLRDGISGPRYFIHSADWRGSG